MLQSVKELFERDLNKLIEEIKQFSKEEEIWFTPNGINNSTGNLCLHICGNLKHFIGTILGNTGYQRQRDREFSLKNVPRLELISNIEETSNVVLKVIENINEEEVNQKYPINVFNREMSTEYFLIHLHSHLNYHLGQINYQRRIMMDKI